MKLSFPSIAGGADLVQDDSARRGPHHSIWFLAIGWLVVALRCFVRVRMLNSFGLDDGFIVASAVSAYIQNTLQ
jgi:hypothetical protein